MPQLEALTAQVIVDTSQVASGVQRARDTLKPLDAKQLIQLELNIVELQRKVTQAKSLLRQELPETERIQVELELNRYKRNLTEAKRELNNYVNT